MPRQLCILAAIALCGCLGPWPLRGAEPVPAPQPVEIPAWVWETTGVGYTLSGMNREQREEAVRHGVTISEMNFVDPFYPYYDSQLLHKRSPHVALGKIEEEIAEYKRLGFKVEVEWY